MAASKDSQGDGERFIAAFNDIEERFRRGLRRDEVARFAEMARVYAARHHLPSVQLDSLLAFAALRNAISHGKYYGGRPIAEPVRAVVADIERLRDQIVSPPRALTVLEDRQVCVTGPDEPIGTVLGHVVSFDYSQIPVYDGTGYAGLLTTWGCPALTDRADGSSGYLPEILPSA